jgi:hypothetical protein
MSDWIWLGDVSGCRSSAGEKWEASTGLVDSDLVAFGPDEALMVVIWLFGEGCEGCDSAHSTRIAARSVCIRANQTKSDVVRRRPLIQSRQTRGQRVRKICLSPGTTGPENRWRNPNTDHQSLPGTRIASSRNSFGIQSAGLGPCGGTHLSAGFLCAWPMGASEGGGIKKGWLEVLGGESKFWDAGCFMRSCDTLYSVHTPQ